MRGWVKIRSFTSPPDNLFDYQPWYLGRTADDKQKYQVADGRPQGDTLVAQLRGVDSREQAAELKGYAVFVERAAFPSLKEGRYYWTDLIGLRVRTITGNELGVVVGLMETGANDVLEVQGERTRLVPFVVNQYVKRVDLVVGEIVVDWDPDF